VVRLIPILLVLATTTAHAGKKNPKVAKYTAAAAAGVSGAVTVAGFMTRPSGDVFNTPVLYTGLGMLFVTPSFGHFYAGQYLTLGMGVRAVATGVAIYAIRTQVRAVRCDEPGASHEPECQAFTEHAVPFLGLAAIAFVGGVWYDVLDAGDAAERHNKKHGFTTPVPVPTVMPGGAPGVTISGYF
jgi:hypothetical protein